MYNYLYFSSSHIITSRVYEVCTASMCTVYGTVQQRVYLCTCIPHYTFSLVWWVNADCSRTRISYTYI